ncbi:SRPBCC domain-containing protein [Terasakiella sp. A23]|uniref:SRPBCC family protein n=1 Tax=Terasakiella sp. FCG-A23 TaxID=3080561 RepID=UPI0029544A2C|nr:SRPBCC domain-containing protein [Terasakiella sp. A23]MDV7340400.1 SRPBCC domain-containing protein [Terasakiella sp. A23]
MSQAVVSRQINHDTVTVFQAFASKEAVEKWFTPSPEMAVKVLAFDFVEKGSYRFEYAIGPDQSVTLFGTFLSIQEARHLSFTWEWVDPMPGGEGTSKVLIDFKPDAMATEIVVTHQDVAELVDQHIHGWEATLDQLEKFLD